MTYTCETCGFLFRRVGPIDSCPCCGSDRLRAANGEEQARLEEVLAAELKNGGKV